MPKHQADGLRRQTYENYLVRRQGRRHARRRPIRPSEQGILLHYLLGAETLGEALNRMQRYHQMLRERLGNGLFRIAQGPGQVSISINYAWREVDDQNLHEATLQSLIPVMHFLQWAVDHPFRFSEVHLTWAPSDASVTTLRHFTNTVLFKHDKIVFVLAETDTRRALIRTLKDLPDYYRHLDYFLSFGYVSRLGRENRFLELVNEFFEKRQRFPSLVELSDIVFQSPATIKRALHSEGLTYRSLIHSCRFITAKRLLRDKQLSIMEIAWRLGYRDHNAFRRAFRNWTGVPPGAWRQAHAIPEDRL